MPTHKHDIVIANAATGITMANAGDHDHDSNGNVRVELGSGGGTVLVPDFAVNTGFDLTTNAGSHKHVLTDPQHGHGVTEATKGSGSSHENRPPFYTVIILQRLV